MLKRLQSIVFIVATLLLLPGTVYAYKLTIYNDSITITDGDNTLGKLERGEGRVFVLKQWSKDSLSLIVDSIKLEYEERELSELTIIEGDSNEIYSGRFRNYPDSMTPFSFVYGKQYTITHGIKYDCTFKLEMEKEPEPELVSGSDDSKTDSQSNNNPTDTETENSSGLEIFLFFIILSFLGFFYYKNKQGYKFCNVKEKNKNIERLEKEKEELTERCEKFEGDICQLRAKVDELENEKALESGKKQNEGDEYAKVITDLQNEYQVLKQEEYKDKIVDGIKKIINDKLKEGKQEKEKAIIDVIKKKQKLNELYEDNLGLEAFFNKVVSALNNGNMPNAPITPERPATSQNITKATLDAEKYRSAMAEWLYDFINVECKCDWVAKNNTLSDIKKKLKERLQNSERPSEEECIERAVKDGGFTNEQRKALLLKFIEVVNERLADDALNIDDSMTYESLVDMLVNRAKAPKNFDEAQMQVRQEIMSVVNASLGEDVAVLDKESIDRALAKRALKDLNDKLPGLHADGIENAFVKLKECMVRDAAVKKLLEKYKVVNVDELKGKMVAEEFASLKKSNSENLKELAIDENIESAHKLVNQLVALAKDSRNVRDELEETLSIKCKGYSSDEKKSAVDLLKSYKSVIAENENELKRSAEAEKQNLQDQIDNLTSEKNIIMNNLQKKEQEVGILQESNMELMSESEKLVDMLHRGAEKIEGSIKQMLCPCSENEEEQCGDIESRLDASVSEFVQRMKNFSCDGDMKPVETRKKIQELLCSEIELENGLVDTICRYYAYSRLPFMTDTSREYGITFKRRNMAGLFGALNEVFVQFGISLDVPLLFVMGIDEGSYENFTGQTYGDLDNLCQNSRNHIENIDSNSKPSDIIVDLVKVGYAVDGNVIRKASVLTY